MRTVGAAAIVCFTSSGSTARRVARERPTVPLLVLTPSLKTARRLGLLWGAHAVRTRDVGSFEEMVGKSKRMALRHGLAKAGDRIIVTAGVPFGVPGSTNVVHVARLIGDELDRHKARRLYVLSSPGTQIRQLPRQEADAADPLGQHPPRLAVQPDAPERRGQRVGAARGEAADDARPARRPSPRWRGRRRRPRSGRRGRPARR